MFAILFVVGTLVFYKSFGLETILWTAILAGIVSLFFLISMGIYQLIYIRINKIPLNDFSIEASQEATFTVDKSIGETIKILETKIPGKINSYSFKYNDKLDFYKTKTGATTRSWGEIIIVKLTRTDALHTVLHILSKPILKTTLIDYGKSSMNIQKIKEEFDQ